MVTAPAAAPPDSHPSPASFSGAVPSYSPTSFQSVYQSLPAPNSDSHDAASSPQPTSNELNCKSGKKGSQKGADDSLPAIAAVSVTIELPPQHAIAITLSPVASASQASANDPQAALLAQLNASGQASTAAQGTAATAAHNASSLMQATVATQPLAQPAPLPTRVMNPDKSPSAATGLARTFNLQDMGGPSTSGLIAPPLPGELQTPPDKAAQDAQEHAAIPARASATGSPAQAGVDPTVINKGLADSIVPRSENLAFSLRMREADSLVHRPQAAPEPPPARSHAGNQPKNEERPSASPPAPAAIRAQSPANMSGDFSAATANLVWSESAAAPRPDSRPAVQLSEPRESINSTAVAAMHEAQLVLPDTPKAPMTGEILLQLGGKDQAAAIRVTDRAGNVNVSVHAADPDLRSSLRSNLGELASQLTHQGWKTDVLKTGTVLTRGENSQDSRQDGQRSSSQQQHFANGDRQPQKDRRASSGQWLEEFEEHATGNSGKPGGTN